MASKTSGSGGTDQTTTVEAGTVYLTRLLQGLELDGTRNPTGQNNIQSGVDEDSRTFSASIILPVNLEKTSDNTSYRITAIDYFTTVSGSPHYAAGTGGTFAASTVQGALIQHIIAQSALENDISKNPTGAKYISYSVGNAPTGSAGNALFNASFNGLPLDVVNNADGSQSTKGKVYLN